MKILKMKLENFQGVKELEIDPQGESSAIYGDNGTGKSTVYNAFTWLMYGKPSTTEKNYTPKTTGRQTKEPMSGSAISAIWQALLTQTSCTPSRTSASMKTKSSA